MNPDLVQALQQEFQLSAKDIADIFWLASHIDQYSESVTPANEPSPSPSAEPSSDSSSSSQTPPESPPQPVSQADNPKNPPENSPEDKSTSSVSPQPPQAEIVPKPEPSQTAPGGGGLPIRLSDAPSLRGPLTLARALKPLMRRVSGGRDWVIDEVATSEQIASQGIWIPVLRPRLEPWLDLDLVIEDCVSMLLWRHTLRDLEKLLKNYGIFRDVRVWSLLTDNPEAVKIRRGIGATAKHQAPRSPRELIDPTGRRLVIVVSDCVSKVWREGKMTPILDLWAKRGSMAILQMLPEWMWKRSGLGWEALVRLQGLNPGDWNQNLKVDEFPLWWDEEVTHQVVKVPIFTLEPESVGSWARLVAGKGNVWAAGYLFKYAEHQRRRQRPNSGGELTAEKRVNGFRATASRVARKLAGLLAAAPVITLPVVRLIQETLLRESLQVNVAEVFLGGLLKPISEIDMETDSELVQYDFMPGVRELLLESVPVDETVRVIDEISRDVAKKLGFANVKEFGAILRNPQQLGEGEVQGNAIAFARVTAQILRSLGGAYIEFAEELESPSVVEAQPTQTQEQQLIQSLLAVRGQNQAVQTILRTHNHLINGNFLQTIKELAQSKSEEGNEELAHWLQDLAAQVAENVVETSPSLELLRQLLQVIVQEGDNLQDVYAVLGDNLDKLNDDFAEVMSSWVREILPSLDSETAKGLMQGIIELSNILQQFSLGFVGENIRISITGYELGLTFFVRESYSIKWADLQINLGVALSQLPWGERAENIERAIQCYEMALEVYRRDTFPEQWAKTLNNLGAAYLDRIRGERSENLERALQCYEMALEVRNRHAYPEEWASLQNNLAAFYSNRIRGERAENIERAIACYEAALEVYTRTAYPEQWASIQNNLGSAFSERIKGERAENIEWAITYYEAALIVRTRSAYPEDWAMTQNNLGSTYRNRLRGERADNIEKAIAHYKLALEVYTRTAYPEQWASIQNNLGAAFSERIKGERAENQERAIAHYKFALEVYTRSVYPEQWAMMQNNLASAFSNRIRGERADNMEEAIRCYMAALEVYTRDYPYEWASIQNNLGSAFSERIRGERADNLEMAIFSHYQAALEVYTRTAYPEQWASIQNNLGSAFSERIRGERAENLERAIFSYNAALEVTPRAPFPEQWAMMQNNLGAAYSHRIKGKRAENLERAIAYYKRALSIYTPSSFPLNALQTGRNLGNLGYNLQNWEIAIEGYNQAILAIEQSRYWATSEATKRELIANCLDIYENVVQACINNQDYPQALLTVERSKSRTLLELLDSANLYPKNATNAQKQRISDLRRQIAIYQQQLAYTPTTENNLNQPSPETLIRQQLQAANQQLQALLTELDDPNFTLTAQVPAQLPDLQRLLPPRTALIEWYLPREAESGFYAFLVTRRDEQIQITPHHFSAEDRQHLDQALQDYRSDYRRPSWNQQLPQRLETLSAALQLPRLLAELSQIQHLILIPHRELHLIPLHALPVSLPSPSGSETKPLQDWFPVQYAPSCQILNYLQNLPPVNREIAPFFAIQNPTKDLEYDDLGVELLCRKFSPHQVLRHDQATLANLTEPDTQTFLEQSHAVHFACHGDFNAHNPLKAYLRLANGEKLTFVDIVTSLSLPVCRLLVLCADQTGLVETSPTDDYMGLSSAFFYAGARTVVASLWNVDELAATLVTLRLYQILPDYPSVTAALQGAQTWLRGLSCDDVLDWLKHEFKATEEELEEVEDRLSLFDDPPFESPHYWAAFVAIAGPSG
ncbi:TPR domain protein [Arthrospira platensis NIES-46]|uniref:TPR domain protein n=1 Tax=Limnospira platensis NIES-46 TaxID=1236695 RepID=A0A5M3T5S4_LIMPL|nr:SAV_2336 N-terminal domain-related protein [Arthrospira platensis]GCE93358.1 TPR domain protein [Arthrospira platensis NIES-46]